MSGPQVFLFRRSLYSDLKEDSEPLDSACAEFLSVNLVFCNAVLNQFRSSELHEGNRTADAVVSALRNQALEEVFGRTAVFGSLEHFERNVAFLNDESEFFAERDSFFILANVNERDLASRIFLHGFFEHCEERSDTDTGGEQAYVGRVGCVEGVPCVLSEVFAKGGEGGKALAEKVLEVLEDRPIQYTYPLEMPLKDKINAIATKIYRADGVNYSAAASKTLAELTEMGYGNLPVCIAKTQYSFSDNAKLIGAPTGFTMEVREVRLAAGAGFVVVICGNIMTMPGLPKKPAAVSIDVDADGKITGLF